MEKEDDDSGHKDLVPYRRKRIIKAVGTIGVCTVKILESLLRWR